MKAYPLLYFAQRILPIFFIAILLSQIIYPQSDNLIVKHYSLEQGLSNSFIGYNITQDRGGYLWFSTDEGIIRYDGYNFDTYVNDLGDTTSFTNAAAISSYMDKEGILWFGTRHGLEKYNRKTNSFTDYLPDRSTKGEMLANFVCYMVEDSKGTFLVTTGKGVYRFNKKSGDFYQVEYDSAYLSGVPFIDKNGHHFSSLSAIFTIGTIPIGGK